MLNNVKNKDRDENYYFSSLSNVGKTGFEPATSSSQN